jgi:hypothetical protein
MVPLPFFHGGTVIKTSVTYQVSHPPAPIPEPLTLTSLSVKHHLADLAASTGPLLPGFYLVTQPDDTLEFYQHGFTKADLREIFLKLADLNQD